jgi:hypothetical protein
MNETVDTLSGVSSDYQDQLRALAGELVTPARFEQEHVPSPRRFRTERTRGDHYRITSYTLGSNVLEHSGAELGSIPEITEPSLSGAEVPLQ